jgi:hypothetical protein
VAHHAAAYMRYPTRVTGTVQAEKAQGGNALPCKPHLVICRVDMYST